MIRIDLIAIALSVALISCNGQTNKEKSTSAEPLVNPQTHIKVEKKYDSKGNLIKFDSTYSYYYSTIKDKKKLRDSVFNNFKNEFNQKYFFSRNPYFNDFFFQDSLLKYDFYRRDFFLNRFHNNLRMMDSLFWGMDSLKNSFFNKQFIIPAPIKTPKIK